MVQGYARRKGFTLVELLVVIGIIVVLAAILLPVFGAVRKRAKAANCMANLHDIGLAMKMAYQDHKSYPGEPVQNGSCQRRVM